MSEATTPTADLLAVLAAGSEEEELPDGEELHRLILRDRELLKRPGICVLGDTGFTALHVLASSSRPEHVVGLLQALDRHPELLNSQTPLRKLTPLLVAVVNRNKEAVRLLLARGALHTCGHPRNDSPLYNAVETNHLEVCRMLLDRGADIKHPHADGSTPLLKAADMGLLEISRLLLDRGATHEANGAGSTPLLLATRRRSYPLIKLLLERGARQLPNPNGVTPILVAVENGDLGIVRLLFDHGATAGQKPLLALAAIRGNREMCQILLERGVPHTPDVQGRTPLEVAAHIYSRNVMRLLLQHGANPTAAVRTAIIMRIASSSWTRDYRQEIVDLLYRDGADLDRGMVAANLECFSGRMVLDVDPELCFTNVRRTCVHSAEVKDVEDVITYVCFALPTLPRRTALEVVWEMGVCDLIYRELRAVSYVSNATLALLELVTFFSVRPAYWLAGHLVRLFNGTTSATEERRVVNVIRRACLLRDMVNSQGTTKTFMPRDVWVIICRFLINAPQVWFGSRFWDRRVGSVSVGVRLRS